MQKYLPENWEQIHTKFLTINDAIAKLNQAKQAGTVLKGCVSKVDNQNNMYIDMGCVTGLIPYHEFEKPYRQGAVISPNRIKAKVNSYLNFIVIATDKISEETVTLSRMQAIEFIKEDLFPSLKIGDVFDGIVENIDKRGTAAFIDIGGGVLGYLHITDASDVRVKDISERFKVGDRVKVSIKSIDVSGKKINLSHRDILGSWEDNASRFKIGDTVPGVIRDRIGVGILVELTPNLMGLIDFEQGIEYGDLIKVQVKAINTETQRIKLKIITDTLTPEVNTSGYVRPDDDPLYDISSSGDDGENETCTTSHVTKSNRSPFAIRLNERVIHTNFFPTPMERVIFNVNCGYINETHFAILDIILEFKYLTSKQLFELMKHRGFTALAQEKIASMIKILVNNTIVALYKFESDEGKALFQSYGLAQNGYNLLKSRDSLLNIRKTDLIKPSVDRLKTSLATNQTYISILDKTKRIITNYYKRPMFQSSPRIMNNPNSCLKVAPSLYIEFEGGESFIFDVIRRNTIPCWEIDFNDNETSKIKRYFNVLTDFRNNFNHEYIMPTALIYVCEDPEHADDVNQLFSYYANFPVKIAYTWDTRLISEEPLSNLIFEVDENQDPRPLFSPENDSVSDVEVPI